MLKKSFLFSSLLLASATFANSASAASIVNGSFDSDLSTGWSTLTDNGTVERDAVNNTAVLSTLSGSGVTPFSAVLVQGDDGFFNFANALLLDSGNDFLKFDVVFDSLGSDALEGGGAIFSDNLQVWMYGADNLGDVLLQKIDLLTGNPNFSIDLTGYVGRLVAFSFELNDNDDGLDSRVTLDNIRLEQRVVPPVTVPEPSSLLLIMLGAFGLFQQRFTSKAKSSM